MFIAVSGGIMSLIDGSYEYYHYLHDGIDDNVMSCGQLFWVFLISLMFLHMLKVVLSSYEDVGFIYVKKTFWGSGFFAAYCLLTFMKCNLYMLIDANSVDV